MPNDYINTYSQLHFQFVFAVKYRKAQIDKIWKEELHKYITGIIQKKDHKMIIINTMPDHLHMLVGFRPNNNISDLVQLVKIQSSNWINDNKLTIDKFQWQSSFGAFSYCKKHLNDPINYIANQESHHHQKIFLEEYIQLLNEFEIEYDQRFIFKDLI